MWLLCALLIVAAEWLGARWPDVTAVVVSWALGVAAVAWRWTCD